MTHATQVKCSKPVLVNEVAQQPWVEISMETGNARLKSGMGFIWLRGAKVFADKKDKVYDVRVIDTKSNVLRFKMDWNVWKNEKDGFEAKLMDTFEKIKASSSIEAMMLRRKRLPISKLPSTSVVPPKIESNEMKNEKSMLTDEEDEFLKPLELMGSPRPTKKRLSLPFQSPPSIVSVKPSNSPTSPKSSEKADKTSFRSPFRSPFRKSDAQKRFLSPSAEESPVVARRRLRRGATESENGDVVGRGRPTRRMRPLADMFDEQVEPKLPPSPIGISIVEDKTTDESQEESNVPKPNAEVVDEVQREQETTKSKYFKSISVPTKPLKMDDINTLKESSPPPKTAYTDAVTVQEKKSEATTKPNANPPTVPQVSPSKSNEKNFSMSEAAFSSFKPLASVSNGLGLVNLGNTCYMNAVLQALMALPIFTDSIENDTWLENYTNLDPSKTIPSNAEEFSFYNEFKAMIESKKKKKLLNPGSLKTALAKRINTFANNSQQDAHEFYSSVLHELEEEMIEIIKKLKKKNEEKKIYSFFKSNKLNPIYFNKLPISKIFQTKIHKKIICVSCSYTRSVMETYHELSLDLPSIQQNKCYCNKIPIELTAKKDGPNKGRKFIKCNQPIPCHFWKWIPTELKSFKLVELLNEHFKSHQVDLICEKCIHGKNAYVNSTIEILPKILVLHLKRFEVNNLNLVKRLDAVEIPEILDPTEWFDGSMKNSSKYSLKCIVRHLGENANEGHYVCDINEGKWIRYNDNIVSEIEKKKIFDGIGAFTGYLLFYSMEN